MSTIANDSAVERHIKHFNDLQFTVVAEAHEYRVEFTIYDIVGWGEGATKGVWDAPLWPKVGAKNGMDTAERIEDAEPYLHGEVEWDGCSNWHFDEQERCMLHGCSKADVQRFGDVMTTCWEWTAELCPTWG